MQRPRRQAQLFSRHWAGARPSVTVLLVAGLTGAFVAQWLIEALQPEMFGDSRWLEQWLAFDGASFSGDQWWQLFTFGFIQAGPLHLLANLLLLYFAGREIEPIIGAKATLGLFLVAQGVGGIVHSLAMPDVALMGVSAGAAAFVAAFATTLPELEVVGHLFFVVPIKTHAKYLGLGLALISALCWFTQSLPDTGPAAALTGCIVGWLGVRRLGFGRPFWFQRMVFDRRRREARLERMPAEQFVAEEIDPILDKIAASGMASLTRAERKILDRGRAKMDSKRG